MSNQSASHQETLNYRLRPNAAGFRLDIWEENPIRESGDASYQFFMTYQVKSANEAKIILERYLITNDIGSAVPSNAKITPHHLRTLAGSNH